ncbi:MAG TPA: class I SAM-dependent methyltransferase [Gemmatimonadales bacterium]|nr:class I SAM-dependent methyltransferase [Gemmatimonadales bacterium]
MADHFSQIAASYASCRPTYPEELFDYLAGLVHGRRLAWDCGAGTGQATIPLARRFDAVIATDISISMLEQAPRHPRVEYRAAPAEASGIPSATVDLVTVAQALHWLDVKAFYEEAARVLLPGGVLAVWTYASPQLEDATLQHHLSRFNREKVGPYWPPERRHVEEGYRTLSFPFAELDPPALAMEERWTLPQLLGYIGTWSATQRFRELAGRDPALDLERKLAPHWGNSTRRVRWPLTLRLGRRPE